MKLPKFGDLQKVFEEWQETMQELMSAIREQSPDVTRLSERAHDTLKTYLRAVEMECAKVEKLRRDLDPRSHSPRGGGITDRPGSEQVLT